MENKNLYNIQTPYIFWKFKGVCQCCGIQTELLKGKDKVYKKNTAVRKYIKPIEKGGKRIESNILLYCYSCEIISNI